MCDHAPSRFVGIVTSHPDKPPTSNHEPHAAMSVCHREKCQRDAQLWVRKQTGILGTFKPFERTR